MIRAVTGAMFLALSVVVTAPAGAGVVMCTDPATGKKIFTDKGCPTAGTGQKVKIQPTNFGHGNRDTAPKGTWASDRDTSVAGRANLARHQRRAAVADKSGYLPSGS